MTQPAKKTDVAAVKQVTVPGNGPIYGPTIFSIYNLSTGREVERVDGYTAALAAQAKWTAYFKSHGQ